MDDGLPSVIFRIWRVCYCNMCVARVGRYRKLEHVAFAASPANPRFRQRGGSDFISPAPVQLSCRTKFDPRQISAPATLFLEPCMDKAHITCKRYQPPPPPPPPWTSRGWKVEVRVLYTDCTITRSRVCCLLFVGTN